MAARPVGRGAQPPAEAGGEVWAAVGPQAHELAIEQHAVAPELPRGIAASSGNSSVQLRPGRERRHTECPPRRS
jgi:hypothetical protein